MLKFSLKIDDVKHSLTAEDGVSFDIIADLLKNLYNAIDDGSGTKCTLGKIRGNCYALDFYTHDEKKEIQFVRIHQDIEEIPFDKLPRKEQNYAKALRPLFNRGLYINAYDKNNNKCAHITELNTDKTPETYFQQKTIYGYLSEIGGDKIDAKIKHIKIEGFNRPIAIKGEDDIKLKDYYGTDKLSVKLNLKTSIKTGRILSAELESFNHISKYGLLRNIEISEYIPLNITGGAKSMDEIIKTLYG